MKQVGIGAWSAFFFASFAAPGLGAQEPASDAASDAAIAEEVDGVAEQGDTMFWRRSRMTGDWGGLRTDLENAGFDFGVVMYADYGKNGHGGAFPWEDEAYAYFVAGLTIDLDKLAGWTGGSLYAAYWFYRGGQMNDLIGAFGGANVNEMPERSQLAELHIDQAFCDERFTLRVGKFDTNSDFGAPSLSGPFAHTGAYYAPTLLFMPTQPDPAFGAALFFQSESFAARAAVQDGALAEDVPTGSRGPKTLFGDPADLYVVAEAGPEWSLDGGLDGRFVLGAAWLTGTLERFDGGNHRDAITPYAYLEQALWKENASEKGDAQGIAAFIRYGRAPERVSPVEHHAMAGALWTGALDGRDDDVVGLGVACSVLTRDPAAGLDHGSEWAFETFYRCQIAPWFAIQPDFQIFLNPGGVSAQGDTWLATLRVEVTF